MTAWLDRLLGRVTMYVLVVIALCGLALAAAVLSMFGWFPFGPAEIAASAVVLIASSYLANRIAGAVVRIRPQTASSLITALLLLFIFPPSLSPAYLGILALAAVIATASKYLLAVRGRHVFNPAAVGAMAVSVVPAFQQHGVFALWWLGTPIMLPFVAVAASAILFRTRKLLLGAVFIAVAAAGWGVLSLTGGAGFLAGASSSLLSYTTVFFAGFMLSEPLTLPPRRWQQLAEAVLVGVLFAAPFTVFGLFSSSPQLALLAGNLFAFLFGQRRGIRLSYVGKTKLTPTSWEFAFEPATPLRFTPGQFMELTLPHARTDARGWRRVFSIASAPGGDVRFGVRLPERSSTFKKALLALEPGARVTATSVGGDFTLPADDSPVLLVAGGIGITPYVSQLAAGGARDVALVYAISTADDLAYAPLLAKAGCSSVTVVAAQKPAKLPRGWRWVASPRLTGDQLLSAVPDARSRHAYLSGTPAMVGSLKRALRRAGVRRIHTDVFIGY